MFTPVVMGLRPDNKIILSRLVLSCLFQGGWGGGKGLVVYFGVKTYRRTDTDGKKKCGRVNKTRNVGW